MNTETLMTKMLTLAEEARKVRIANTIRMGRRCYLAFAHRHGVKAEDLKVLRLFSFCGIQVMQDKDLRPTVANVYDQHGKLMTVIDCETGTEKEIA